MYSKRTWLNDPKSSYTASVVAYDGKLKYRKSKKSEHITLLEIGDCHQKIKIHRGYAKKENKRDFIAKLKLLASEITEFVTYLEKS